MNKLEQLEKDYNNKVTDIKYQHAVNLLGLISDEDYAQLCDDNEELISPISDDDGDAYLHRQDILDQLIEVFTDFINSKVPNPEDLNSEELKEYIKSLIEPLDEDRLRGITKVIQNMLGL